MTPSVHRITLDYEGDDQYVEILLSSAPVVRVSNIEFKRQLFTSHVWDQTMDLVHSLIAYPQKSLYRQ